LLKGYAVTLTFKVAAQMLHVTRRLNMVIISVKLFQNLTTNKEVMGRTRFSCMTLTFKLLTQMLRATRRLNMVIISVKYFRNPTSNNEVMGRTRFCCKVML